MTHFLCPHFLSDPQQYEEAEGFWLKHREELVREVGQADRWKSPHYTTTFVERDTVPRWQSDLQRR